MLHFLLHSYGNIRRGRMQGGKQIFLSWALYFMADTGSNPEWLIDLPSKKHRETVFL